MKKYFYLKPAKWMAAYLSCLTMIFAPVAMGKEAEAMTKQSLQQTIKELGLDKKTTLAEFWQNAKADIPGYIYKDLEAFVNENKNMQMPEVAVNSSKTTDGREVPVLHFTQNGKTQTFQIYGEQDKWAKFNTVTLTADDLASGENAFRRIEGSDINIKKQGDKFRQSKVELQQNSALQNAYKKDFARFQGFPRVTPQMWKSLSKQERAGYIVKMRLMWMNARKVLATSEKTGVAPTKKSKPSAAIENFYRAIFGEEAQAAAPFMAPPPTTGGQVSGKATPSAAVRVQGESVRVKDAQGKTKVVSIPYNAQTCVVAGYIGAYGTVDNINGNRRAGCSIDLAIATYEKNDNLKFIQQANEQCKTTNGPSSVACNPIIYGYPENGCIDRKSPEYQHATHFSSPSGNDTCDKKSQLSSSDDIIKFNEKNYKDVQPRENQIAAIEADQQKEDYALTNTYLKGVLAKKDGILAATFEKGEWNLALDEELVKTQLQFEEEIGRAIKTCEEDFAKTATREANQKLACDQLHRRWLFTERAIAKLRDKACLKPALYIGLYDGKESSFAESAKDKTALNKRNIDAKGTELCGCPVPKPAAALTEAVPDPKAKPKLVNFGQSCEAPVVAPPPVPPPKCAEDLEPATVDGAAMCVCKDRPEVFVKPGEPAPNCKKEDPKPTCDKPVGIAGFDYEKCQCEDHKKLKNAAGDDGGYTCEGRNWIPWIIAGIGAAILALIAIFHHKPKPKDPLPPAATCTAPKTGTPPNCACTNVCTVGVINPETCGCSTPPATCAAPKVGTPPACVCPTSNTCTPNQQIYDTTTCQCTNVPKCADNSIPTAGNMALCPKCADGSYKTTPSSTRPGGCPAEGGGGTNCPQGGCSGGLPGTGH